MDQRYTAEDVARGLRAIDAANGSVSQAAKDTGYARTTLRAWKAGRLPRDVKAEAVAAAEPGAAKAMAAEFRQVRTLYIEHLRKPEVVAKASAQQAAIVVGILEDKAVRAEGGPTSISENRHVRVSLIEPDSLRSGELRVIEGGRSLERESA